MDKIELPTSYPPILKQACEQPTFGQSFRAILSTGLIIDFEGAIPVDETWVHFATINKVNGKESKSMPNGLGVRVKAIAALADIQDHGVNETVTEDEN